MKRPPCWTRRTPPSPASFWRTCSTPWADAPLDYLVVNHMEPDHCANIEALALRFPGMKIVGNAKTFTFMKQFYDLPLEELMITVKEGDTLSLGSHTLHFYMAPW